MRHTAAIIRPVLLIALCQRLPRLARLLRLTPSERWEPEIFG